MLITQDYLKEYFSDENNLFILWNEQNRLVMNEEYFPMEYLSLFIIKRGTVTIQTPLKTEVADSGHLQFFNSDKPVKIIATSEDIASVGIIFSRRLWNHTLLHAHPYLSISLIQPVIEIGMDSRNVLLDFLEHIQFLCSSGRHDKDHLVMNTILGLFFHVGGAYENFSRHYQKGTQPKVVSDFLDLLFKHYRDHKDVEFYASKLYMQKDHFSTVIKKSTGMTAGHCIRRYIVLKICSMLKNTNKSVKEISLEFNFQDPSHFCKFFRRYMGESPEEYRRHFHQNDII